MQQDTQSSNNRLEFAFTAGHSKVQISDGKEGVLSSAQFGVLNFLMLQHAEKGGKSLSTSLTEFKAICDQLNVMDKPVPDGTKVFRLLEGIGEKYELFKTTMLRPPLPTYAQVLPQRGDLLYLRSWAGCKDTRRSTTVKVPTMFPPTSGNVSQPASGFTLPVRSTSTGYLRRWPLNWDTSSAAYCFQFDSLRDLTLLTQSRLSGRSNRSSRPPMCSAQSDIL
ncbi:hypothetical protein RJ640_027187 [Escallonia rubra]|uniref:Uncharacterized protein n=1 Tax=Escallonia rubra TaxID=112253 RepID=A0AA88R7U3_9ASTE|nr:hypothetical protein RJ640_027187 [Escallonia rubra]